MQYGVSLLCAGVLTLLFSVAIPHALAEHAGERLITWFIAPLNWLRWGMTPITAVWQLTDRIVERASGGRNTAEADAEEIEQEILSVVEEGEKEGVVGEQERAMIESVMEFSDTQAGEIMTARPDIIALDVHASLHEVKKLAEGSGHSRIPVYEGSLDHVVGVLYVRDL